MLKSVGYVPDRYVSAHCISRMYIAGQSISVPGSMLSRPIYDLMIRQFRFLILTEVRDVN